MVIGGGFWCVGYVGVVLGVGCFIVCVGIVYWVGKFVGGYYGLGLVSCWF